MSQADLDVLEQDVEAARNRLADDIERLRDPAAMSGFRRDVMATASSLKDDLVQQASGTVSVTARRVWSDLKDRAAANPGAALAIGAGLAWHLARHPPITTLLVGLGFTSLMRTDPSSGPAPAVRRATELAGTVKEKAEEWSEEARDAAGMLGQKAREFGGEAQEVAEDIVAGALKKAGATAALAQRALPDHDARDPYLLGAAALAIGAAAAIAIRRKGD